MRSGKGASMFVPSNYKTVTAGTITQSRITVGFIEFVLTLNIVLKYFICDMIFLLEYI